MLWSSQQRNVYTEEDGALDGVNLRAINLASENVCQKRYGSIRCTGKEKSRVFKYADEAMGPAATKISMHPFQYPKSNSFV